MEDTNAKISFTGLLTGRPDGILSADPLAFLLPLSLALINALTIDQVLDTIIFEGLSALHADTGALCLLTDDGAHLEAARTYGLPPQIVRQYDQIPLDTPLPIADAVRQGEMIVLSQSAEREARYPHHGDIGKASSEQTWLAAIPLKVQDRVVGAICLTCTDRGPLGAAGRACMETVAQLFASAIERARRYEAERSAREIAEQKFEQKVRESDDNARDFFGSLTDGFIGYNRKWQVMYVNEVAAATARLPQEALLARVIWDIFPELVDSAYYTACHQVMNEHRPAHRDDYWPRYDVWIENHIFPIRDGVAVMFRDITERKRLEAQLRAIASDNARLFQAERERSDQLCLAVSEVHHRVKNSLQAVAALLEMQIPDDENVMPVEAARDSLSQIKTIALVHDLLAHDKPIGLVDTARVLTNLAKLLSEGMRTDHRPLPIRVDAVSVEMPTKSATSLALVVNELLTNAAKHNEELNANDSADDGGIEVSLTCDNGNVAVVVRDHGPGFSPDFDSVRDAHIGLQLVQMLVSHDLGGRIVFGNAMSDDGTRIAGAKIEICFPMSHLTE